MVNKRKLLTIWMSLLFFAGGTSVAQSSQESAGRAAEQAGNLLQAFTNYVAALQSVSEDSPDDQRLREKIIGIALKLTPVPDPPDEARRLSVRGITGIGIADATAKTDNRKAESDYLDAIGEFRRATRIAPWWPEAYQNLGLAQEKAGRLREAVRSYRLYVLAAPKANNLLTVKNKIDELEYRMERTTKAEEEARAAQLQRQRAEEQFRAEQIPGLAGLWENTSMNGNEVLQVTVTGNRIRIVLHAFWSGTRTRRWLYWDDLPCPWRWDGVISGLDLTLTFSYVCANPGSADAQRAWRPPEQVRGSIRPDFSAIEIDRRGTLKKARN